VRFVRAIVAFSFLGASSGVTLDRPAQAQPGRPPQEIVMGGFHEPFGRQAAQDFLSRTLPLATAGNPKYRSGGGEELTAWLTKSVHFAPGPRASGTKIAMSEEAIVFRDGAQTAINAHEVAFAIEDVRIFEYEYPSDTTETGEKAVGVMFRCKTGKCIRSKWNGQVSDAQEADLYLQDATLRGRILKAFAILAKAGR
jgi:hypothetical protein